MNAFNSKHSLLLSGNNVSSPPILTSISGGNTSATLKFNRPSFPNNPSISYTYYYKYNPGSIIGELIGPPYTITGLENGITYSIQLRAYSRNKYSNYSNAITVIPSTIPGAFTIVAVKTGLSGSTLVGSGNAIIEFSEPTNTGGSPILSYSLDYSYNEVFTTYTSITNILESPYTLTGLKDGSVFYIRLYALNANGPGPFYSISGISSYIPAQMTLSVSSVGDTSISINYVAPNSNGSPITHYRIYMSTSTITSSLTSPATLVKTLTSSEFSSYSTGITLNTSIEYPLTNGTRYYVVMFAENANGYGPISNVIDAIPDVKPETVTNFSTTPGYKSITVNFDAPPSNNGGSAITYYRIYYSTDTITTSTLTYDDVTTTTGISSYIKTITDLIEGSIYNIAIASFNTLLSDLSTTNSSSRPYTNPSQPGKPSLAPGDRQMTINFAASSDDGYGTISYYRVYYSIDPATVTTSTLTFVDFTTNTGVLNPTSPTLTNGSKYNVAIAAYNGQYSVLSESSSAYPFTQAGPITVNSVVAGDKTITVNFTPPNNGGFDIHTYSSQISDKVNADGSPDITGNIQYPTFEPPTNNSIVFSNLTNGKTYYILLVAQTINLNIGTSLNDNTRVWGTSLNVRPNVIPYTDPSAPEFSLSIASGTITITNTVPNGNNSTSTPNNGGSPLIDYILSTDPYADTFSRSSTLFTILAAINDNTTTNCNITGLTNGTLYTITLKAVNNKGNSLPTIKTATPDVKPGTITTFSTTPGYKSITVNFTAPSNTGSAINYYRIYYSKSPVAVSTSSRYVQVASTGVSTYLKVITETDGLTVDGSYYNIAIASFNTLSSDLSTTNSSSRPYTNPSQPGKPSLAPGDRQMTINFAASSDDGYGTISYYRVYYSIDPATVTTSTLTFVDFTTNTGVLNPTSPTLTNGSKYNVAIAAYNGQYSVLSESSSAYPFTQAGPITVNSVVAGDKTITVNFTPPNNGGFDIHTYSSQISDKVNADGSPDITGNIQYPTFEPPTNNSIVFSNLTNGKTYYILLVAQTINLNIGTSLNDNTRVWGTSLNVRPNVIPYTDPSPPTNVNSGFYNGTIVVTFKAPTTTNGGVNLSYILIIDTALLSNGKIYRGSTNSVYTSTVTQSGDTYKYTVTQLNSPLNGPILNGTTYYLTLFSATKNPNDLSKPLYGEITTLITVIPLAGTPTYTVAAGPSSIKFTGITEFTGFGTDGYYLYTSTSNSFSDVTPENIGKVITFTKGSLYNGTKYWVKLVAYNDYGTSSDGVIYSVTPTIGTFTNVVFGKMALFGSKLYYPVFNSVYSLDSETYQYAIVELSTTPIKITKVSSLSAYPLMFFNVNGVMNLLYSTSTVRGDGTTTISGGFNATSNYFYGYNSGSNGGFFGSRNVLKIGTANTTDNTISEAGSSPLNGNTFAAADILNDNSSLILVTDTNGPTVKYWNPPSSSSISSVTSSTTMNYCTGIEFFAGNGFFCAYSTNTSAYSAGTYKTFFIAKGTYADNTLTTTYAKFFDASSSLIGGGVTQNHITSITYSASYLYVALYGTAASGNGSNISKVYKLTTSGTSATIVSGWPVTTIGMIQSMIVYNTTLHYSTYTNGVYTIYSIAA